MDTVTNNENIGSSEYRFELNVEGMTCVRCTQKVEKAIKECEVTIKSLKIDFITNRVLFTVLEKDNVQIIVKKLEDVGVKVKNVKDITKSLSDERRILTLNIIKGHKDTLTRTLFNNEDSFLTEEPRMTGNKKCAITYNPISIRGGELIKKLQETPEFLDGTFLFSIENPFEEDIDQIKFSDFSKKQFINVLVINILNIILSFLPEEYMMIPHGFGMFSYYYLAALVLTILSLKVVGFEIYATCIKQLIASFSVNMLTLVSIGSGIALNFGIIYSALGFFNMFFFEGHQLHFFIMNAGHMFHTSATIFTSLVVGKYLEGKIKKRIYSKIEELKNKLQVKVNSVQRIIPKNRKFDALLKEDLAPLLVEKDDYIQVPSTGMIPFDGFIEKGRVKVVENIQYGWEKVEIKTKGHPIISGSQVIEAEEGEVIMRVTEPLEKTLAGRLFHEIKEAAVSSSSKEGKDNGDVLGSVTKYFIAVVFVVASLTFFGWWFVIFRQESGEISYAYPFEKLTAVLVASCPCALGIAIPMIYAIALRKGFKAGAMIKDTSSLDTFQTIDTIIFDKTGTITGTYNIKEAINHTHKYDEVTLWEIISLVEKDHLQHPVGLALFQEAMSNHIDKSHHHIVTRNEHDKGLHEYFASEGIIEKGITIDDQQTTIALGNRKLLERLNVPIPQVNSPHLSIGFDESGSSTKQSQSEELYLCIDNEVQLKISLSLEENLKKNVAEVISHLRRQKKDIYILSGDNKQNASHIGQKIGIPLSNIHAEMDPEGKEKFIQDLIKNQNRKVMMVGDGINDIKAFKASALSCSINFKSSQNLTFSDFIIINNDVSAISSLFNLAVVSNRFKKLILICALFYNIPVILAASGALKTAYGIDLEAYFACWTMVVFSLLLTALSNVMEFVNIKNLNNEATTSFGLLSLFSLYINRLNRFNAKGYKATLEKFSEEDNQLKITNV